MEIYKEFSAVYDHFMDDVPYEQWGKFIRQMLLTDGGREERALGEPQGSKPIGQGLVLDLGCGTGTMTEILARYGYDMIGIDNSSAMLEVAKNKEESSQHNILYLQQDMGEFELYGSVKAVICVCDTINYILELSALKQVFRLVEHYLDPGGLFLFDFNTDYKYREVIGHQTIAENRKEKSFIWENYFYEEERINEIELSLFVKESQGKSANPSVENQVKSADCCAENQEKFANGSVEDDFTGPAMDGEATRGIPYRKYIETHHQRAYHLQEMIEALEEAGLEYIKAYDNYAHEEVHEKSQRIVVVAKKNKR